MNFDFWLLFLTTFLDLSFLPAVSCVFPSPSPSICQTSKSFLVQCFRLKLRRPPSCPICSQSISLRCQMYFSLSFCVFHTRLLSPCQIILKHFLHSNFLPQFFHSSFVCTHHVSNSPDSAVSTSIKVSSHTAQYPILRIAQSALQFTSLADLFTQTPSQLLWEASSHTLQIMHEDCSYTYPPPSIAWYSFTQLSVLEQRSAKQFAQGFNTAAQKSKPGPFSRESETLPLSHYALQHGSLLLFPIIVSKPQRQQLSY